MLDNWQSMHKSGEASATKLTSFLSESYNSSLNNNRTERVFQLVCGIGRQCTMCCLCSTMALWYFGYSRKNTFSWENNIFEAILPTFFQEENLKTCFAFHFPALKMLFLEHSKSVQMTRKSQI